MQRVYFSVNFFSGFLAFFGRKKNYKNLRIKNNNNGNNTTTNTLWVRCASIKLKEPEVYEIV